MAKKATTETPTETPVEKPKRRREPAVYIVVSQTAMPDNPPTFSDPMAARKSLKDGASDGTYQILRIVDTISVKTETVTLRKLS